MWEQCYLGSSWSPPFSFSIFTATWQTRRRSHGEDITVTHSCPFKTRMRPCGDFGAKNPSLYCVESIHMQVILYCLPTKNIVVDVLSFDLAQYHSLHSLSAFYMLNQGVAPRLGYTCQQRFKPSAWSWRWKRTRIGGFVEFRHVQEQVEQGN